MKRILIILFIVTIIISGCNKVKRNETINIDYKTISSEEAKEIIDNEEVIILDVRTQAEYESGHIENSILLPVTDISSKAEEMLPDKDAKILIYCRSGNRSATAASQLIRMGYANVYDFGGIISWPYQIVQ